MTNREFFNAILAASVSEELKDFASAEIAKLDARNDKRRNTLSKEQKANEEIKVQILDFLAGKSDVLASDIANGMGISTQKASALCRQLVENGKLSVAEIKIKGKGAVKGYTVA